MKLYVVVIDTGGHRVPHVAGIYDTSDRAWAVVAGMKREFKNRACVSERDLNITECPERILENPLTLLAQQAV